MLMGRTSRPVRFWISCRRRSISAPLRPIIIPGRAVWMDLQLVARTLDFDVRHARGLQLVLETLFELQVLVEKLGVILLREPARLPGLVVTQAEPVRMYFLTHPFLLQLGNRE